MKKVLVSLAAVATGLAAQAADIVVTDGGANDIVGTTVWTKNNTYILDGRVFVESGETLVIEAGTVIRGRARAVQDASALVVARGGKIYALGTKNAPIIMTAEDDNLTLPQDLDPLVSSGRGRWGGLVVLGNAGLNRANGTGAIEGIPGTEPRGTYGGGATPNDTESSGILRYISIRHAGALLGANNELNGLTMGGVGSGTITEFIEVIGNADDGYEWFGGTNNTRFIVGAFNDDDGFDWDEGYRGKGQFFFNLQGDASNLGEHAFEMDGGTSPESGQPYAIPTIYNVTAIGSGVAGANGISRGPIFRDNSGGYFWNSIFTEQRSYQLRIETESAQAEDSAKRLAAGDLALRNNIFGPAGTADTARFVSINVTSGGPAPATQYTQNEVTNPANGNRITDPGLRAIGRAFNGVLDPRPAPGSAATTGFATPPNDGFFLPVSYVGAFSTSTNWMQGWTYLSQAGVLSAGAAPAVSQAVNISTRANVGTVDNVAIAGFVITGELPKAVLIRAIGEELVQQGVATPLQNPTMTLFQGQTALATVDDLADSGVPAAAIQQISARIGAFPVSATTKSSVAYLILNPGAYTVVVSGVNGGTGIALIEVYDAD